MTEQHNIILIMADALRADRISATGYRRDGERTTPNIDELAEDGALYPRAYSPGPWTADAQSAVLTGEYASNMGFPAQGTPLSESHRTIGEYFSEQGYETRAYNMSAHVREGLGFGRGFDYWEDVWSKDRIEPDPRYMEGMLWNLVRGSDQRTRYMTREIERWITDREDDRPFFLFWNPTNPHNKYRAPRGFRGLEREIEPGMDREAIEEVAGWGHCREYVTDELELTDEEMDVVESRYDAEIRYLDHRVGQIIDHLKHQEIYDDTTIVFTSDHGENFGEKGLLYHNFGLNEALTQVPLIIKGEGFQKTEEPVSTIDLLNSLNKQVKGEGIPGVSSKPALLKGEKDRELVLAERGGRETDITELKEKKEKLEKPYEWYKSGKKAVVDSSRKLVKVEGIQNKMFEIGSERVEEKPLSAEDSEKLSSVIEKRMNSEESRSDGVDEESVKQELKKLGYD